MDRHWLEILIHQKLYIQLNVDLWEKIFGLKAIKWMDTYMRIVVVILVQHGCGIIMYNIILWYCLLVVMVSHVICTLDYRSHTRGWTNTWYGSCSWIIEIHNDLPTFITYLMDLIGCNPCLRIASGWQGMSFKCNTRIDPQSYNTSSPEAIKTKSREESTEQFP